MSFAGPLVLLLLAQQDQRVLRLSEEAEILAQSAGKIIAEETLRQKALKTSRRFYPRVGQSALEPPPGKYQDREIKSEFGYTLIGEGKQAVFHEARQVLSVDGKSKQSADKARRRLVSGLRSSDDEVKKQLLEDLEKHGLEGSATDFTLMLLLFRPRNLSSMYLKPLRQANIGAESAVVYSFWQEEGPEAFTIFHGKETLRQRLEGEVWLRASDGLPLRIVFDAKIPGENDKVIVDHGEVDYVRAANGIVTPVSAIHRRSSGDVMIAENRFSYSEFKRFGADSEIKFTPIEESGQPAKP